MTDITSPSAQEKLVAYVIQGDDVFRITTHEVTLSSGAATDSAFQGIAKLKAATALFQLTSVHKERPDELQRMAQELAAEGMHLLAQSTAHGRSPNTAADSGIDESSNEIRIA